MKIIENFPLLELNTFRVSATARWYVEIQNETDLSTLFSDPKWMDIPRLILGAGSNMLFTKDFPGIVIHINIKGITEEFEDEDVVVSAGGGEVWNELVNYCVDREFAGIENLSLIPGTVGASPVQNIGAYGVELMNVFHSCRAFEISSGEMRIFGNSDCGFSYRDSVFKSDLRDSYIITQVSFKLSRKFLPNISYGAISAALNAKGILQPGIRDVSKAVSEIRVSKLPDPSTIGNAGSFFKNPIIAVDKFVQLQSNFPDIVNYPAGADRIKLAAGWLIENCGWKGKVIGRVGTWKNQALVLVNHGGATGNELYELSEAIIQSVQQKFGIRLEREVNII